MNDFAKVTVGIAGGTGAGKTTFARTVYKDLNESTNIAYLVHDNYYKDLSHLPLEERAKNNFDHPDSLDTDLLIQHICELKKGNTVEVPVYDFTTHTRTKEVEFVEPKKIILVEGILIFSDPNLVQHLDLKVFVDADPDIRLMRRISRDISERGRTVMDVMKQYTGTVRRMHDSFVEPSKSVADIIVYSHSKDDKDTSMALKMIKNHLLVEANLL